MASRQAVSNRWQPPLIPCGCWKTVKIPVTMTFAPRRTQGVSQHEDYVALMKWMQKHYGKPAWESTVRSHRFARWFVDFDRDIVMIATASAGVEVWFYENHQVRNVDYYSILKYCERYPNDNVPYLTAEEQVTWKSTAPPEVTKKKVSKRRRAVRRHRTKAKSRKRRRR